MSVIEHFRQNAKMRRHKIHLFQPKISMAPIEFGPYLLKTAETKEELIQSFQLRHDVFACEFKGQTRSGLDFDRFDYFFDHLIIIEKQSKKIIGTYRVNSYAAADESYTATEFDLQGVLGLPGPHLELGRACIHKSCRKGAVIALLWRGIAEYMRRAGSNLLFGCSSIKVETGREAALIFRYLQMRGSVQEKLASKPTTDFELPDFDLWLSWFKEELSEEQQAEAENLLPSLLKSYLKMGAKVMSYPAYDRDFNCIDMLTALSRHDLNSAAAKRYSL